MPEPDLHLRRNLTTRCFNEDCNNCDWSVQYCHFLQCIISAAIFHKEVKESNWRATEEQCRQE